MKRKIIEFGKNILIVALICSLLLLSAAALPTETIRNHQWLSQLLAPMSPLLGLSQAELTYVQTELPVLDASQPICISVNSEAGRSTAMWDFAALDSDFETFGGILGQAMDTAEDFTPVTQADVKTVLSGPSVSFQYEGMLPASLLAFWLDAHPDDELPAVDQCILAPDNGLVTLYLVGEAFLMAPTQVDSQPLEQLLSHTKPDGSHFAFETDLKLAPFSIVPQELPTLYSAVASNPCNPAYVDSLATAFGFNPYNETRYQDGSGTIFFSEVNSSLQISAGGHLLLTSASPDRFKAPGTSVEALVEYARHLIHTAAVPGNSRLYLTGFTQEDDKTVCTFDYFYHAIPLAMAEGHGGKVTFQGSSVTELDLQILRLTRAEQPLYPLPIAQVTALLPQGAPLSLQYYINADHMLTIGWKASE